MFTNNYIKFRDMMFIGSSSYEGFVSSSGTSYRAHAQYSSSGDIGAYMHQARCRDILTGEASSMNSSYPGIYFGSGTAEPTRDDYRLESQITSGLSIVNPSGFAWSIGAEGRRHATATFTVTNSSSDEITISEVGYYSPLSSSSSKYYQVLMERQVLSEPIVIQPGEAKIVTYELVFNQSSGV